VKSLTREYSARSDRLRRAATCGPPCTEPTFFLKRDTFTRRRKIPEAFNLLRALFVRVMTALNETAR